MPRKIIRRGFHCIKPKVRLLRKKTTHAPLGLTLTEVVVASALLIIAIVPILKALTGAYVTGSIIHRRTRSLLLAQAKLDEIRARSIYGYAGDFTENSLSLDGPYLCNVVDSAISADLRKISVSVGHDLNGDYSLPNAEIEITLTTLLARRW